MNSNHRPSVHISVAALTEFIACALERAGLPQQDARTAATLMGQADQQECGPFRVLRGRAHVYWDRLQLRVPTLKVSSQLLIEHSRPHL
jgi:hypothetical protein